MAPVLFAILRSGLMLWDDFLVLSWFPEMFGLEWWEDDLSLHCLDHPVQEVVLMALTLLSTHGQHE